MQNQQIRTLAHKNNQKYHFQDLLNCQICYCKASSPSLCPYCSKIYCQGCLNKSLKIKPECPNCRKNIKGQVANCSRFINQISSIVFSLIQSQQQLQKCRSHGISLNYFCQQCDIPACCECKMFGQHQSHKFKQIGKVYEQRRQRIKQKLSELKQMIFEEQKNIFKIQNSLIDVRNKIDIQLIQIDQQTQKLKNKLVLQQQNQHQSKGKLQSNIKKQIKQIKKIKKQLFNNFKQSKKNHCYKFSQHFFKYIQQQLQKSKKLLQINNNNHFLEEVIPPYKKFKFIIQPYSILKQQIQAIQSQQYEYEGSYWKINVYMKGNNKDGQFLSVFVELTRNPDQIRKYDYQIQIINSLDNKLNITRQHQAKFMIKQCWGFGRLIKNNQLVKNNYINTDRDCLQVQFSIRLPYYNQLYKRRMLLFNKLTKQLKQKQNIISSYQSSLQEI